MHELTLCESILDILDDEKRRRGFLGLRRLRIEIGRFGCVDPDALVFALETTTRGGPFEGAIFEVIRLPGRLSCLDCGSTIDVDAPLLACPNCGGVRLARGGGDELRLAEMEVTWPAPRPLPHPAPEDTACASPCR